MNKFLKKVIFIVPVLFFAFNFTNVKADTGIFASQDPLNPLFESITVTYQLDKLNYNKLDIVHFIVTAAENQTTLSLGPCGALNSYGGQCNTAGGQYQSSQYQFSNLEMKDLYVAYNPPPCLSFSVVSPACTPGNFTISLFPGGLSIMQPFSNNTTDNNYDYTQISTDRIVYKNNSIISNSLLPNIFNYLIPNTATSGSYRTFITMKPIRTGYSVYGRFSAPFYINDPAPQIFVK